MAREDAPILGGCDWESCRRTVLAGMGHVLPIRVSRDFDFAGAKRWRLPIGCAPGRLSVFRSN